jgi:bifunctional non-homologous end joining protein LigD
MADIAAGKGKGRSAVHPEGQGQGRRGLEDAVQGRARGLKPRPARTFDRRIEAARPGPKGAQSQGQAGQDRRRPARLHRAPAVQVCSTVRRPARLGARDQVRRLSHAAARRGRPGRAAHPQGPRLDREVRRIAEAAADLPDGILDGEVVALDAAPARLRGPAGGAVGRRHRRPDLLRLRPAGGRARTCATCRCASARRG